MRLTSLDLGIFILYMLAVLGLGLYAARRGTKTKRDYFLAGDKLPWWMIGGSIAAETRASALASDPELQRRYLGVEPLSH